MFRNDYRIIIPMELSSEESLEDVKKVAKKIDLDIIQKASFLMKSMLERGCRRCIVYLNTKEECKEFNKVWKLLGDNYYGHPTSSHILYKNTTYEKQDEILKTFANTEKDYFLNIIVNYQGLDKVISIPRCDSTFLINLNNINDVNEYNEYNIVERFKRGFIQDYLNKFKTNVCFLYCKNNDFEPLKDFLIMIKKRLKDENFEKKVVIANQTYDKMGDNNVANKVKNIQEVMNKLINEWN